MAVILETKGVCKYFSGLKAVNMVDMKVNEGSIFGIIGPNGAGKTTFFNLCSGTYNVTAGEIYFENENITNLPPEEIAERGIIRTFQNIKLFKYLNQYWKMSRQAAIFIQKLLFLMLFCTQNGIRKMKRMQSSRQ